MLMNLQELKYNCNKTIIFIIGFIAAVRSVVYML